MRIVSVRSTHTHGPEIRCVYDTYIYTRGMQYIAGKREGVVWCISVPYTLLAYISRNNSLIPRSSPPPTVTCKTTGGERFGKRQYRTSNVCRCLWSNILTWVCGKLWDGSYCCRQQGLKAFGSGLKGCKLRG